MAKRRTEKLFTLAQVSRKTGISLASLRRYRRAHAARIPSQGAGRRQRFPAAALPVFASLKEEGMARRGRGRKRSGGRGAGGHALLTLVEIGRRTGISYPTLLRYVRLHLGRLPHTGSGRKRRFRPEAVAVFQELRGQSRRGSGAGASSIAGARSLARQLERLERGQRDLARQIRELRKSLNRPVRIQLQR